jgi:TPR repeat protein
MITRHIAQASEWALKPLDDIRRTAELGDAQAQFQLGYIYEGGMLVPQNSTEAIKWYSSAANQRYGPAQYSLGVMYAYDTNVPRDNVRAYMWFSLAASELSPADPPVWYSNGLAVPERNLVARKMTPEQIAQAQKLASEWAPPS